MTGLGLGAAVSFKNKSSGPAFHPLNSIAWHTAFWASDSLWTPPADGAGVSSWRDGSGNSRSATQVTGTKQPLYRASVAALNNKPAIDFDGVDDTLVVTPFTAIAQPFTRYAVIAAKSAVASNKHIVSTDGVTRADLFVYNDLGAYVFAIHAGTLKYQGQELTTARFVLGGEFNGVSSKIRVNTVDNGGSSNAGANSVSTLHIGATNDTLFFNSYIAFVGQYAGILTEQQKTDFYNWAVSFYG